VGSAAGQASWPAEHVCPQTPPEHLWPGMQALPQEPQFSGSVRALVQNAEAPLPHLSGVAAGHAQVLLEQICPGSQPTPQPPQLLGSLRVVAQ
jgi:hypothetical protein